MKSFSKFIVEVAQPSERGASEEQAFKDQHTYEVIPHPVALDHQHTGEIVGTEPTKDKGARPADQKGAGAYDQAYKKGNSEVFDAMESVKNTLADALSAKQKKLDHNNNGKIDGHDLAQLRKGKKKDLDELSPSTMQSYQKKADKQSAKAFNKADDIEDKAADKGDDVWSSNSKASDKHSKLMGTGEKRAAGARLARKKLIAKGAKSPKMSFEEVEQLAELSPETLKSYKKKAMKQYKQSANRKNPGGGDYGSATKATQDKHQKRFDKRHKGIGSEIKRTTDDTIHFKDQKGLVRKDPKANSLSGKPAPYKYRAESYVHDIAEDMNKVHTVDIDHMGGADAAAKKHNITLKKSKGTPDSHSATGKKKDLQKYLAHHYDSAEDAKDIHPEVHETTQSAMKRPVRQTGPDGKTRTVMKSVKRNDTDEHGQDKIVTNESILMELEENMKFKMGNLRLKNGKSVKVSKQDADLLNQMFKDLNPTNRRKLGAVAIKDPAGFEEIVGFAREAL